VTKPSAARAARSSSSASKKSSAERTAAQRKSGASAARKAARKSARNGDGARVARIIAVANQKGGVGKSTTAVSLGAALAELGHRVLVVDLDPQGNASTGLGIRHEAREVTVYDVLAAEAPIEGAIVATPLENLFAIPSTIDLAGAEIELVSQFSREQRLRRAIDPLRNGAYDYVFLDCPPSLGLLTVNALAAAEELIVPIQCEYYALEGLGQLLRNVRLVQQNVNTDLRLTGIVMTMFDTRTKLSEQVVDEVRKYFGDRVYRTIIPRTVRLSEAPGFGLPITSYDPGSKGAEAYRQLAREVHERPPDESPLPAMEEIPEVVAPSPEPVVARAPRPLVAPTDEPDTPSLPDEPEAALPEPTGTPAEPERMDGVTVEVAERLPQPEAPEPESDRSLEEAQVEPPPALDEPESAVGGNGEAEPEREEPGAGIEASEEDRWSPGETPGPEPDGEAPTDRQKDGKTGGRLRGLFRRGGRS
jgi:chromosome partitioning protein